MEGKIAVLKLARVQKRGQVTLPPEVRKQLGIKSKDMLVFEFDRDGTIRLDVIPFATLDELLARYPGDGQPVDVEAITAEAEREQADELLRAMGLAHA